MYTYIQYVYTYSKPGMLLMLPFARVMLLQKENNCSTASGTSPARCFILPAL